MEAAAFSVCFQLIYCASMASVASGVQLFTAQCMPCNHATAALDTMPLSPYWHFSGWYLLTVFGAWMRHFNNRSAVCTQVRAHFIIA